MSRNNVDILFFWKKRPVRKREGKLILKDYLFERGRFWVEIWNWEFNSEEKTI